VPRKQTAAVLKERDMSIKEKAGSGLGVLICVCVGKPEAMVSLGNIRAVPESKEISKTDFFIISPRDS